MLAAFQDRRTQVAGITNSVYFGTRWFVSVDFILHANALQLGTVILKRMRTLVLQL
jgi:hypothetical protein